MARHKVKLTPEGVIVVKSRPLITLYDGDSLKTDLGGALVRYYPDAGLTSVEVERRVQQIRQAGAESVKVNTKQRDAEGVQTTDDDSTERRRSVGERKDSREVVMREAARMQNVDQTMLTRVLETALSQVGL